MTTIISDAAVINIHDPAIPLSEEARIVVLEEVRVVPSKELRLVIFCRSCEVELKSRGYATSESPLEHATEYSPTLSVKQKMEMR